MIDGIWNFLQIYTDSVALHVAPRAAFTFTYPLKYFNFHLKDWHSILYRHSWLPTDFSDPITFPLGHLKVAICSLEWNL